jgi:hypothetical protein
MLSGSRRSWGRPEIVDFWGLGGPGGPKQPFQKVGGFAPKLLEWFLGPPGPPRPHNSAISGRPQKRFPAGPKISGRPQNPTPRHRARRDARAPLDLEQIWVFVRDRLPDYHFLKEIVGVGPIPARIRGFFIFNLALSTARLFLGPLLEPHIVDAWIQACFDLAPKAMYYKPKCT